jgi:dTDP-4-amino-4,6-dideoxygalactose transaminase
MKQVPVPLLDLRAQYLGLRDEIDTAVRKVIEGQQFLGGADVEALEREVAAYCNVDHCVGVSSASDALLLALTALGVGPGDEVITTSYAPIAAAAAVARLGARPVFMDIDRATYNLRPDLVEAAVSPQTRAIIPVHLFGQCADMGPILEVARNHGLAVIEDATQALGADYQTRRAGGMGTFGCLSFSPGSSLGGYGEAGAVVTRDTALAGRLRCLRNQGQSAKFVHRFVGGDFGLDALQAAVLQVKLRRLDAWTQRRQEHAAFYDVAFRAAGLRDGMVQTPTVVQSGHVFEHYVVRVTDRDAVRDSLARQQVGSAVYYPVPLHLQPCFAGLGHRPGDFPESEEAARSTLALPIHPELSDEQRQRVVEAVVSYYQQAERVSWRKVA